MKRIKEKKIEKTEFFDPYIEEIKKITVKQSYDKILSFNEKEAMIEILDEEKEYKDKLNFLKNKKEREREERIDRIKKLRLNN